MLIILFYLAIRHVGIHQLRHNLLLIGIGKEAVAVLIHLTAEVVLDVLLSLRKDNFLAHPLVDIVVNDGGAILSADALTDKSGEVVHT